MIYLFLQSVVPTVPAAWLTFAEGAVYKAYDTAGPGVGAQRHRRPAARRGDHEDRRLDLPVDDHRHPVVQALRRRRTATSTTTGAAGTMPNAEIVGHDDEPLTSDDVEREFARSPPADEPDPTGAAEPEPTGSPEGR